MNQNLRIPILSPIKLRIRPGRLIDPNLMTDNERRLGTARDDHVAQVAIVGLYVTLASPYCESLWRLLADRSLFVVRERGVLR